MPQGRLPTAMPSAGRNLAASIHRDGATAPIARVDPAAIRRTTRIGREPMGRAWSSLS
jgi:hypothetical protein